MARRCRGSEAAVQRRERAEGIASVVWDGARGDRAKVVRALGIHWFSSLLPPPRRNRILWSERDVVVSKGGSIQASKRRSALSKPLWKILLLIQSTCDDWRIGPGCPKQFECSLGTRFYHEPLVFSTQATSCFKKTLARGTQRRERGLEQRRCDASGRCVAPAMVQRYDDPSAGLWLTSDPLVPLSLQR